MEPARAFVVPKAERKTFGGGESAFRASTHFEVSASTSGLRFEAVVGIALRAIAWIVGCDPREVMVVRMWDPCSGMVSMSSLVICVVC